MSRYNKRRIAANNVDKYKNSEIFENRGVKSIKQYNTPSMKRFTREQYNSVQYTRHIWVNGDRFWKLANKHYNNPTLWWVIARWNFTPTESHIKEGDEIRIPKDLRKAMEIING